MRCRSRTICWRWPRRKARGHARLIGVSNFPIADLERTFALLGDGAIATDQIEIHPYLQIPRLRDFARQRGLPLTAYQPLVKGEVSRDPVLARIGERHGVGAAAVGLAFLMAEGHIVIPASSSEANLRANFKALDVQALGRRDGRDPHARSRLSPHQPGKVTEVGRLGRTAVATNKAQLSAIYRDYIACLNQQDWPNLAQFVHDEVCHNGRRIGLSGYREMLEKDFREIPDLHFSIQLLISDPPHIASRLSFDCTPKGEFLGLQVNGKRVSFAENVFYEFRSEKIWQVWSVIDKAAIEAQL